MMKAPSKTKLTIIKSYIDMALSNPEDWYGAIQLMHRIETEIRELYPREERFEIERRLRGEEEPPTSNDPETQELVAAAKQWREEQKMIEDTNEVVRDGETCKETQDRILREMQDDYSDAAFAVVRSASFLVCQELVKQKTKTQEEQE
jgi:hypothetical protein